jgi:hypothetical protein
MAPLLFVVTNNWASLLVTDFLPAVELEWLGCLSGLVRVPGQARAQVELMGLIS